MNWYHGSDHKIKKLLPSDVLDLDYPTETGAWLTSSYEQAKLYGKNVTEYDVSDLNILDASNKTKVGFVTDYWVDKGYDHKDVINALRTENEFKEFYDGAFLDLVVEKGYDAVKLKGEFGRGFDLWISRNGTNKLWQVKINEFKNFVKSISI